MSSGKIHNFSDSGLHTALLAALIGIVALILVDAFFFTPEGRTPVIWRLDRVVVEGQATPPGQLPGR
ncbi:hypothetical protein [Paucibacter soli]|uniref:hypothetical protein n=1 Tax=Paucibacter soli TaxID=3133433 RepID=UPI0030A2DC86